METAPLPQDVVKLGADGINHLWREKKLRAVGIKRAQTLVEAAQNSIGLDGGACARMEMQMLLEDYRAKEVQLEKVTAVLEAETLKIPYRRTERKVYRLDKREHQCLKTAPQYSKKKLRKVSIAISETLWYLCLLRKG